MATDDHAPPGADPRTPAAAGTSAPPIDDDRQRAFGVFKPVGHVVISFPRREQAEATAAELPALGVQDGEIRRYTDDEMLRQIDDDLAHASPVSAIGQERNLVLAHRALAEQGYHWLVVRAPDDTQAAQVAEVARRHGAERAQAYGRFIIEELITRADGPAQVAESPDRGLDAETPSGREADRVQAPPPDGEPRG